MSNRKNSNTYNTQPNRDNHPNLNDLRNRNQSDQNPDNLDKTNQPTDQTNLDNADSTSTQGNTQPEESVESTTQNHSEDSNLSSELNSNQKDAEFWHNTSLRLGAELQNLQKQHELDTKQVQKRTKKAVSTILLDFLNTLNLAFTYAPKSEDEKINSFITTLEVSYRKLMQDLLNVQIEILTAKPGEAFNPEYMSILNADSQNDENENVSVKHTVTLGLRVDGQVIQPVSVMI